MLFRSFGARSDGVWMPVGSCFLPPGVLDLGVFGVRKSVLLLDFGFLIGVVGFRVFVDASFG